MDGGRGGLQSTLVQRRSDRTEQLSFHFVRCVLNEVFHTFKGHVPVFGREMCLYHNIINLITTEYKVAPPRKPREWYIRQLKINSYLKKYLYRHEVMCFTINVMILI